MSPLMRDVMALAGATCIVLAGWLIHPAIAFLLVGGGLLYVWNAVVPDEGDSTPRSTPMLTDPQIFMGPADLTLGDGIEMAQRTQNEREERLAASAQAAEARYMRNQG